MNDAQQHHHQQKQQQQQKVTQNDVIKNVLRSFKAK